MTNLVTRLRDNYCHLCHEAADEIERLRTALRQLAHKAGEELGGFHSIVTFAEDALENLPDEPSTPFDPDTIPECRCGVQHWPPCPAVKSTVVHASDCATNNSPALPVGSCDCQEKPDCAYCHGDGSPCKHCGGSGSASGW